jgi:hypothetical protein
LRRDGAVLGVIRAERGNSQTSLDAGLQSAPLMIAKSFATLKAW